MKSTKRTLGLLVASGAMLLVGDTDSRGGLRAGAKAQTVAADGETAQARIALAMSAGPSGVAKSARIVDTDARGNIVVLREGSNGFTCVPGNPEVIGDPPACSDAAAMQWSADFKAHKAKPTNTVPGIIYMLAARPYNHGQAPAGDAHLLGRYAMAPKP